MTSRSPRSIVFPLTVCFAVSPLVAAAANVAAPKVIRTGPAVQPAAVGVNALVNPGVGVPVTAAPFGAAATPSLPAYQTPSLLAAPMVEGEVGFAMPESAAVVPAVAPAPFKAEPGQGDAKSAFSEVKEAGQALLEGKAVESDGAGSAPQVLTRVFDGSKLEVASAKGEVQGAFSLSASQSHLGKPPKEALPDIDPQWKPAALSQDRRLRYRVTGGSVKEFGEDVKIESRKEDLKLVEDAAGFAESKLEGPLQDKVSARAWTAPSGIKAVASLRKSDNEALAWLDEKGAVRFHNFSDNKTYKVEAGARVDLIAASAAGRELYVLTGGSLQKWDLLAMAVVKETLLVGGQPHQVEDAVSLSPAKQGSDDGIRVVTKSGRLYWIKERLIEMTRKDEIVDLHGNLITGVESAGGGLYLAKSAEGTRIYSAGVDGEESLLEEVGTLPLEVKALARSPVRSIYFAVTSEGLVEYESKAGRYMVFKVPGLSEALATGLAAALDMRWESIKISVGDRVFEARIAEAREFLASRSAEVRLWSQDNPMYVEGGYLRIGSFKFKIAAKTPATRSWSRRAWNKALRLFGRGVPDGVLDLGISEMDWRALNLPSNKRLIYDTLKGFSLNQHILYIGETGGGKTWIATMLAKLTGNDLWMVSMNEYTRNKDLIARETFGE
ncbi:MAG: AAA family ATPase, partial [Elusimicrobia bacterium]|nr:AAA family ATPase [Elusimicrobiota bacterium]